MPVEYKIPRNGDFMSTLKLRGGLQHPLVGQAGGAALQIDDAAVTEGRLSVSAASARTGGLATIPDSYS